MDPAADSSPLQPTNSGEGEGDKAAGDRSGQVWRQEFVTNVTRVRGLLKAAREAVAIGEAERADRVLSAAQRALAALVACTESGDPQSDTSVHQHHSAHLPSSQ